MSFARLFEASRTKFGVKIPSGANLLNEAIVARNKRFLVLSVVNTVNLLGKIVDELSKSHTKIPVNSNFQKDVRALLLRYEREYLN